MSVQVLLASVAGILFLLTCVVGIVYFIDGIRFKNESQTCAKELGGFVGFEGFFDTRSKTFFKASPKNPIKELAECQFPDFSGYVPKVIPCKISAIYPTSRFSPEFSAFVDIDFNQPIPIYVKILYVGKEIVVFSSDNTPEIAKPRSFFGKKRIQKGDIVSLDLFITKYTVNRFVCDIAPSKV